jgi:hypothetical protein
MRLAKFPLALLTGIAVPSACSDSSLPTLPNSVNEGVRPQTAVK